MPTCFLVDNGSLRAASTLSLRAIANELTKETGEAVVPVSLLHSSAVDPGELNGIPAEILEPALRRRLGEGEENFLLLPLFFGPSLALTEYVPKRVVAIRKKFPALKVHTAPCLFDERNGSDLRLASILKERVEAKIQPGEKPPVILVDHGSPAPAVTQVRNFVAGQLSALLQGRIARLVPASMERRPGDEFRFGEPLLETVLAREEFSGGRVIVALLFLSPGRHAGEGGDIATICREAEANHPDLNVVTTDLVGNHPGLIPILADRLRQGLRPAGWQ